ncbi:ribonuclease HI [Gardnerella sp. KA00603]|uniref:ribonuclease H n=1 Tax=Gardnerella vaginalis 1500E TaxID=698957 RepID=I4LZT4_GARVA|nr:ribonuclease H [Gardnerella vaginalis 1500E]
MIVVSTDGSALGNPNGSMGWAWADHGFEAGSTSEHHHTGNADAGGATNGTNQIGELCAVLEALRAHPGSEPLTIETDSQYAINCSTTWIHGWKKNGWKNSKNEPVKNADLIRAIDAEITKREGAVKFVWVKGHAGNAGNEKVDTLARTYAEDCRNGLKDGYLPLEGWKSLLSSPYASGTDVPEDAKALMENKISCEEYHIGRAVGEDTNPDFVKNSNTQDASKIAENMQDSTQKSNEADESNEAHESEIKPEIKPQITPQPVPGLSVSGVLQFTPPPNTSPTFNGQARFISGTINVSGYVEPDGTLRLSPTDFYLNQANK